MAAHNAVWHVLADKRCNGWQSGNPLALMFMRLPRARSPPVAVSMPVLAELRDAGWTEQSRSGAGVSNHPA